MDNNKTFLVAAFASIAIAAFATPGGPGTGSRRSAFSSPNDPFHDTYKKNTGQILIQPQQRGLPHAGCQPVADRKSTRLNSSHPTTSRMPSSA